MAQWLRVCLAEQETQVLIPGPRTKLARATTRESGGRNGRSHMPQPRFDTAEFKKKKKPTMITDLFYFRNTVLIFLLKIF